jgi:hypothetical protein
MGLLYVGGHYYDLRTGRFLTPNHDNFDPRRPGTLNPYLSLIFLVPLVALVGRRRGRRRRQGERIAFWLLFSFSLTTTLTSCQESGGETTVTSTPTAGEIQQAPTASSTPAPTATTTPTATATSTPPPTLTPTITPCPTPVTAVATPTPTPNPHYQPPIFLQDWEQGILAAVIALENIGQPIDFLYYSAWVLRNRYESNQFPSDPASLVFAPGQYDVVPTWFSRNLEVSAWLNQYPNGQNFGAVP